MEIYLRNEAIKFHILEQISLRKQKHTAFFYKITSILDDITSNYGYNAFRAFCFLIITPICFFIIYYLISAYLSKSFHIDLFNCFSFTIDQILHPFKIWGSNYIAKINNIIVSRFTIVKLIATINSFFVISFAAIFLASIKRQYRLI